MKVSLSLKKILLLAGGVGVAGLCGVFVASAPAAVTGQCALCHTMHNSQNGATWPGNTTNPNLALIGNGAGCVGCHTGTNTSNIGTSSQPIPYIMSSSAPTYGDTGTEASANTLAGGSFYWVASTGGAADAKGHNVVGIAGQDGAIGLTPPGWSPSFNANGTVAGGAGTWSSQLTCAGTTGCHGDHSKTDDFSAVSGSHHEKDSTIDGTTVGKSYRFLKGILGKEDSKWEFPATLSATAHNQYKGEARTGGGAPPTTTSTISYLCAECHGKFHSGTSPEGIANSTAWGSPWIRHPTDFDMNAVKTKEYGGYNGSGNPYSVVAPVASTDVSAVKSAVLSAAGDAIVTCISCHRAHGTPYNDLLRWDYGLMVANGGAGLTNKGCFVCHTTKN